MHTRTLIFATASAPSASPHPAPIVHDYSPAESSSDAAPARHASKTQAPAFPGTDPNPVPPPAPPAPDPSAPDSPGTTAPSSSPHDPVPMPASAPGQLKGPRHTRRNSPPPA